MNKEEQTTQNTSKHLITGVVVSNKMKDTVVVAVERFVKHPKYHKFVKSTKRYQAHDAGNTAQVGDKVSLVETKPISKNKRFILDSNQ